MASWAELIFFVFVFIFFEFRNKRKEQKEKRREESEKKVQLFNICIVIAIKTFFNKHKDDNKLVKMFLEKDKDLIAQLCNYIYKKSHIPVDYSEHYIKYLIFSIKSFHKKTGKENEPINNEEICSYCERVYNYLFDGLYEYSNAMKSGMVCDIYDFFTDKQIDKMFDYITKKFETLTNFKL